MPCGKVVHKKKVGKKTGSGAAKKKKKAPPSMWRRYVKYMVRKNPGKSLKSLLKGYSKSDYAKFKKNPTSFL